jgi:hypothetical protein
VPTQADSALQNEAFYDLLMTPGMDKTAIDAVNDYTRLKMREDGIFRRILPPIQLANTDLDRQYDTSLPAKVVDMEVDSPAAVTVPLAQFPTQVYIRGQRYRVLISRILSPWFAADVDELRTHVMDIRQVLSDNSIKDMLAEEDSSFFSGVNSILGSADTANAFSGVEQWKTLPGSISRNTLWDAKKIMPTTDGHLVPTKAVINNVSIMEVCKIGRDEMGGDMSQELFKNGWTEARFMDMDWIITIKRWLVPDNTMYLFADPKFMGKFYLLEDTTMFIERRAFFLSFFSYEALGSTIANPYSLVRVDFAA